MTLLGQNTLYDVKSEYVEFKMGKLPNLRRRAPKLSRPVEQRQTSPSHCSKSFHRFSLFFEKALN